jgi:hypothetical protein
VTVSINTLNAECRHRRLSVVIPSVVRLNIMRGASTTTKAKEKNKYHWNPQNFCKKYYECFSKFHLKNRFILANLTIVFVNELYLLVAKNILNFFEKQSRIFVWVG